MTEMFKFVFVYSIAVWVGIWLYAQIDPAVNFGQWTAIALLLLNFLRASGREDMRHDVERAAARFRKEPDTRLTGLQERADEALKEKEMDDWLLAAKRSYDRTLRRYDREFPGWRGDRKWLITCWFKALPGKLAEVVMRRPR